MHPWRNTLLTCLIDLLANDETNFLLQKQYQNYNNEEYEYNNIKYSYYLQEGCIIFPADFYKKEEGNIYNNNM